MIIPYRDLFIAMAQRGIRYLVAGGFAVNFHQVQRATMDLDLIVWLERDNILRFLDMAEELGFVPRLPVLALDFADANTRQDWIEQKGMMVFSLVHRHNPFETIDIFSQEPAPFDELAGRALQIKVFGVTVPVVGRDDLIAMKKRAGRDKDLFDIAQLEKVGRAQ